MITTDEAHKIINKNLPLRKVETRSLLDSYNYVLAETIFSDIDLPSFNKSAMDGYAIRAVDLQKAPVELEMIETVAAGEQAKKNVKPGKTIKIMTGAPVPDGADTVIKKEVTKEEGGLIKFLEPAKKGSNICYQGEDLKKGEMVLQAGSLIRAPQIGVLAAVGAKSVKVFLKPSVAVLTTGDELVEIDKKPRAAQIRNSNSYFLITQMHQLGLSADHIGIAKDKKAELSRKIKKGLTKDILIITGGVSAGDYDIVEPVLSELGVNILFDRVAIKPGKPFVFGVKESDKHKCLVFALPGNPVSAFVITELFIRPAIAKMTDNTSLEYKKLKAQLDQSKLKVSDREQYIPAYYDSETNLVKPVLWHGSADMVALTKANALIVIQANLKLTPEDPVRIILLQ